MNPGMLIGIGSYLLWGLLPLFWKLLGDISALEVLSHRMLWSFVFFLFLIVARRDFTVINRIKKEPKQLFFYLISSILISLNWFVYIWCVINGHVVEASLGYFINPLIAVALGVIFLKERLQIMQLGAIILALLGVLYLTFVFGSLPWRGLILAFSFGLYGLVKKGVKLPSIEGMTVETCFQFVPALLYIIYLSNNGTGNFGAGKPYLSILFIISGIVTGFPLLLFSIASKKITLSQLGILQYISPTLQMLIGIIVYQEPFPLNKLIGFCLIWISVILYTYEGVRRYRQNGLFNSRRKKLNS